MAKRPLAFKDNVDCQLDGNISAAATTIPLVSGNGALLPQTYNGAATSGGSSTALNSTGIGSSGVAVNDIIENVTDGSYAVVISVSTDAIVTSPLVGGSDNTWQNSDVWAVNRFIITLVQFDVDGETILKREKVLVRARVGDSLTVETGGRGYDGSSAQSFVAGDHVYQFTIAAAFAGINVMLADMVRTATTLAALVDTKVTNTGAEIFVASSTGNDTYAATSTPAVAALTNGLTLRLKVDVGNTDGATFNFCGLGAKNIYKIDGATALVTGDFIANGIYTLGYNTSLNGGSGGWLLVSPSALGPAVGTDNTVFPYTCGENVSQGDLLAITATDTVKRYAPTALPTSYDQAVSLASTFAYSNAARGGVISNMSTTVKALIYADSNAGSAAASLLRIPMTPSSGLPGTLTTQLNVMALVDPTTVDAVPCGASKTLIASSKANSFSGVVADLAGSISLGTPVAIDTSNVSEGFCEYISDSHVLFFARNTSGASVDFYKYTLSGTTLSTSSTGTVFTLAGKTFVLKGVRRFGTSDYFLFIVQNDTDSTAQAVIAHYNQGTSSFDVVGTVTNFTGSQQLLNTAGSFATMASLDDTHIIVQCPSSTTVDQTFLVSRSSGSSTTPVFGAFNSYTGGTAHGYSLSRLNARCAVSCAMSGTTLTMKVWEVDTTGTDIAVRVSTTRTTPPGLSGLVSNGLCAGFYVNPTRIGLAGIDDSSNDWSVGSGLYTLPPHAGIATLAGVAAGSVNVIDGGHCDDVSGLTAAQKYYADIGGLLTLDSNGSPDKIGRSKDTTEIQVGAW